MFNELIEQMHFERSFLKNLSVNIFGGAADDIIYKYRKSHAIDNAIISRTIIAQTVWEGFGDSYLGIG